MEVNGKKESRQISLDISPLFYHIVSKLVQALVIKYDEILQALAFGGDILLPKPFLGPTVPPRLGLLALSRVWQAEENIPEAGDFHLTTPSKPKSRNGFMEARRLRLPPGFGKSHRTL
jgi:hypothetical protein